MDIDGFFNAAAKAGNRVHLLDARNKKAAQLRNVQARRCGNCQHWMKSSCAPEKRHGQFKSCDSVACVAFALADPGGLIPQFEKELKDINDQLHSAQSAAR